MNIYEYQAKEIFKKYNIPVLKGKIAQNSKEAQEIAKELGKECVLKAQVYAGGRAKGCILETKLKGIEKADGFKNAKKIAEKMLGNHLVTNQTNQSGIKIEKVYIEQLCEINREIYFSISADRKTAKIIIIIGILGGIDIEKSSKDKIITNYIDIVKGLPSNLGQEIADSLNLKENEALQFNDIMQNCYKLFIDLECSLLEINPLVIDKNAKIFALDAKLSFDDNALFRHLELKELTDEKAENSLEKVAKENGISYVSLDNGQIGCLVNGAGLAMATMDIIKYFGAKPANFLDIGGGAPKERVVKALEIILEDKRVKAILINIFGGIMRCDVLAQGLIDAVNQIGIKVPIIVRLKGTNEDIGKNILKESGLDFIAADDLDDAAQKVLKAALRS